MAKLIGLHCLGRSDRQAQIQGVSTAVAAGQDLLTI